MMIYAAVCIAIFKLFRIPVNPAVGGLVVEVPVTPACKAIAGRVFNAKVSEIIDVMAQGQLQPSGALIDPQAPERLAPGQTLAKIDLVDDMSSSSCRGASLPMLQSIPNIGTMSLFHARFS
jgi:hypothetical protein